jgi:hypothetical protein
MARDEDRQNRALDRETDKKGEQNGMRVKRNRY